MLGVELAAILSGARAVGTLPATVTALETDSRRVRPGAAFFALRGQRVDGHAFLATALANGAALLVVEREAPLDVAQLVVGDTQRAISQAADAFFGFPSRALRIAGVTGTNGKTTTVHLLAAILGAAGWPCATIGTLGTSFGALMRGSANTTPLALELHAVLAELRAAGAAAVAMEVSSHALALGRVDDVRFAVAAFTNLTRDHLDFHGSLEAYAEAKRRIFGLAPAAAINVDDPAYALDAPAHLRAADVELTPSGSRFRIDSSVVELPLRGRFNVYNALAAFASARALGVADATIVGALGGASAVPGRMERFADAGVDVLVDYAHTPDALENVLRAAREATPGRVIVVFGCGGDRDPGKRAQMGAIATRLADRAIVTSDNPRSEDPLAIARAVAGDTGAEIELDRRRAIRRAIDAAAAGDTVVVAGKGHEAYQIVGATTQPFDDRLEVRAALAERARAQAVG
jgi:UDP-N-acetylmuramoyl-L-alanyl-D-glutamate--2,6-diaminopimelate ligase